jgi:nucleoside phosphorylase
MPRVVILTALDVEFQAVRTHLTDLQDDRSPQGTAYERGKFVANGHEWEVGIVEVGAGNAGAAVETAEAIKHFQPDILFFVGIAGGIKDVDIGDVVVATDVYNYESGKVESGGQFSTRPVAEKSNPQLVEEARSIKRKGEWLQRLSNIPDPQPRVYVKPIASGEKVHATIESKDFKLLRERYNDAIAVEMEGFGFLKAASKYPEIKAIVIRGISDLIKDKNDDAIEPEPVRQEKASHHASAFAFEILANHNNYQIKNSSTHSTLNTQLSNDFQEFLENTGIKFAHRNREHISLNDLFVYPDLIIKNQSLEKPPFNIPGEKLWEDENRLLILGDEQSGKTSLAKRLFIDAISYKYLPLLIEGGSIKSSRIEEQIAKLVETTYSFITAQDFLQGDNLVCIVDDLSKNKLNKKAKSKLIAQLNSIFSRTIILAETSFIYIAPDFPELDDYKELEILSLGNVRRSQLIEKWVELESTEEVDDLQVWAKKDELQLHVDSLVRKNIVPAKPFHILMLLQSFETMTSHRLELTAYGHCYQYLIYQALERVHVKQTEIDTYFNVLSELGGVILESSSESSESLDKSELDTFFEKYSNDFLPVDQNKVIGDLVNSFILQRSDNVLKFRYRYLFYFFAAKKIAESLQKEKREKAKNKIKSLVNKIHLEKASNIVLFLTFHSKDPWIMDEILLSVMDIFSDEKAVTLEAGSLSFLQDFIKQIPELILEERDARQERLKHDRQKDRIEEQQEDRNRYVDENQDPSELIEKVNKVVRAIEVCGQIFRNRLGSLERDYLELIYEESLSVSLRLLNVFLRFSEYVREESIRKIKNKIEQNQNISNSKIIKEIEYFYLGMNYMVILGMLYKISFSLGSVKGREIYIKVTESKGNPAWRLIQEIIELQFEKKLDINKIDKLNIEFSKNYICQRFLKEIILRHCYMHDIGYRERQKLAAKLNISMQTQRSITMASKGTVKG